MGRKVKNENLTQDIIDYLEKHAPVTREKICIDLHITHRPKETLSEQIKKIRQQGYIIISPPRSGLIQNIEKPQHHYESIDNSSIIKTLILMILSSHKRALSQAEIESEILHFIGNYDEKAITIYKYLNQLKKEHYIIYENKQYNQTSLTPYFLVNKPESYTHFFDDYSNLIKVTPSLKTLKNLYFKINSIIDLKSNNTVIDNIYSSQKGSSFNQATLNNLRILNQYLYKKYQLEIEYENFKKEKSRFLFSVGLVVFSYEKNNIYLFGEINHKKVILKLANIISIKETTCLNRIYESQLYKQIFDEMFSISIDEPLNIEILFKDFKTRNIRNKISNLVSIRNNNSQNIQLASIQECDNDNEFIYKDTIRGLSDFAKYLRTFGSNVIVKKPEELKQLMIQSATLIQNNYESRGIINESQ